MTMPANKAKSAVILSGGGAYGAYEVGVLRALTSGESPATANTPLLPDMYLGTSAGSFNAAVMTAQGNQSPAKAAEVLEDAWLNMISDRAGRCGNGVYRIRGVPNVLDTDCWRRSPLAVLSEFADDAQYLVRDFAFRAGRFARSKDGLAQRLLSSIELSGPITTGPFAGVCRELITSEGLRNARERLGVTATNLDDGSLRVFEKDEIADAVGVDAILASSAVPGFFPAVTIEGDVYVDGGVLMNTPIAPAIKWGADELHIVYLDPDVGSIDPNNLRNTLAVLDRVIVVTFAFAMATQVERSRDINRTLDLLEGKGQERLSPEDAEAFYRAAARVLRQGAARRYRKLTIHRYHPTEDLGGAIGMLNFGLDQAKRLIEHGYNDTVAHDCDRDGCVGMDIPEKVVVAGAGGGPAVGR